MQDYAEILEEIEAYSGSAGSTSEKKNSLTSEKKEAQPPTTGHTAKNAYRVSAHACTWRFKLEGIPKRGKFKEIRLRNGLIVRYWRFQGCTIQANRKTLFVSARKGKTKNSRQALYAAWDRADKARRAFSTWQQVAISPEETASMAGAKKAHIVIEAPRSLQAALEPYAPKAPLPPIAARARLTRDGSDGYKPEFENIDAGEGIDFLVLDFPREHRESRQIDAQRWQGLEAEIALLHAETAKLAEGVAAMIKSRRNQGRF